MASETLPQPIPLTILTGFLGAGKTTLLNRILHADHDLKLALLVAPRLQDLGFELQHEHLELYGRCRQCRRAEAAVRAEAASSVSSDALSATQGA